MTASSIFMKGIRRRTSGIWHLSSLSIVVSGCDIVICLHRLPCRVLVRKWLD